MSQPLELTTQLPVAVIETDAFCEGCGFNLHTQKVWRDERLGIAICRCPECGRHHAAGMRTTAGSAWARRAALGGLVVWLVVQLGFVAAVFFGLIGVQALASEGLTVTGHMTRDGQMLIYRQLPNAVGGKGFSAEFALGEDQPFTVPPDDVVWGKRLVPWLSGAARQADPTYYREYASPLDAAIAMSLIVPALLACGAIFASLAWYWRRGMKWLWLLLPAIATLIVVGLIVQDDPGGKMWTGVPTVTSTVEVRLAIIVCALMVLVLAVGLAIGRTFMRLVVSILIPPKARQLFAFLWHCDGKAMPSTV